MHQVTDVLSCNRCGKQERIQITVHTVEEIILGLKSAIYKAGFSTYRPLCFNCVVQAARRKRTKWKRKPDECPCEVSQICNIDPVDCEQSKERSQLPGIKVQSNDKMP